MKDRWKQIHKGAILISCCMLLLGIVMIVWPEISALTVCWILGVLCIAAGIFEIVRYAGMGAISMFFRSDLLLGICGILVGLLLLLHPYGAMALLPLAVGIYLVVKSIFDLRIAVEMQHMGLRNWWGILVLGIISTILAFCLILNPFGGAMALMILVGAALIAGSVQNLYLIRCISGLIRDSKSEDSIVWEED